jgi:hypothetical protein
MLIITAIVGAIATIVGFVYYSAAIIKYRQQTSQTIATISRSNNSTIQANVEYRLLICGLLTFVTMILIVICFISNVFALIFPSGNSFVSFGNAVWIYAHTLFCMLNPWTLAVFSNSSRQSLIAVIRRSVMTSSSSNIVHPIAPSLGS